MKMTKQQLKQIIKEELGGVLREMGPDFPEEELPHGDELDQALDTGSPPAPDPDPAVAEMNRWYAENPMASAEEIQKVWSDIWHSFRPGAAE